MSAPAASEASPSQIAAASSPAAILADRFGTGIFDDEIDHDLDDQGDHAPDQAIHDIGGVGDGADHRQHEAEQAEAERDRGRRIIVADQLEFIVRRDAGVDEEVGDDGNDGRCRNRPGTPAVRPVIEGIIQSGPPESKRPCSWQRCRHEPIAVCAHPRDAFNPQTKTPPFAAGSSLGGVSRTGSRGKPVIRRECALRPRAARAARSRGPRRSR